MIKTNKRNRIKRKDITERKSRVGLFQRETEGEGGQAPKAETGSKGRSSELERGIGEGDGGIM